jgi:hypothetical protein
VRRWVLKFGPAITLGDVIVEDGDIFGDGVNVAARLEALAEPGGICISRTVRDQIRDKLAYAFEDLGEQRMSEILLSGGSSGVGLISLDACRLPQPQYVRNLRCIAPRDASSAGLETPDVSKFRPRSLRTP